MHICVQYKIFQSGSILERLYWKLSKNSKEFQDPRQSTAANWIREQKLSLPLWPVLPGSWLFNLSQQGEKHEETLKNKLKSPGISESATDF